MTGLADVADTYYNDFNDLSDADFFGNGFTVSNPGAGFTDGAINSTHPYLAAGNAGQLNFIYNLKIPIRIAPEEAIMKFDEIVLVEPGTDGVPWPDPDFFDYVVVEGSTDGGTTWIPVADGYDCRYDDAWNTLWKNTFNGENSTAVATPSLYRTHSFNLLDKFQAGDEVAFRFRLYSDPLASGWGWAIDNLKIQVDETPPDIKHKHYDYVLAGTSSIKLDMKVTDYHGISQIFIDYNLNGGSVTTYEVLVSPTTDLYSSTIDLSALGIKAGDEFQYRIRASDSTGNVGSFPFSGFIKTAIISLDTTPVNEMVEDFNSTSTSITGNFFQVQITTNAHGYLTTGHPYETGLGIDENSDFTFMTKKPIKVSATNSRIYYEDLALVEYNLGGVKDYVVVEATKDGVNWHQLLFPYAANAFNDWKSMFDTGATPPASTPLKSHQFDITFDGTFKPGDVILVRFRLHSDSVKSGYGWVVDNLSIQGSVTGLEPQYGTGSIVCPWPNPIADGSLYLRLSLPTPSDVNVEIINLQGQVVSTDQFSSPSGVFDRSYDVSNWSAGIYLVKVKSVLGTSVTKLIKLR
ncbi:MAG: T9SS type A sorting domain-containing protein [Bacteroidota bacterium]